MARRMRQVARRGILWGMGVLFIVVVAAWVRGFWSDDSIVLQREAMDESGWRIWQLHIEWSGGALSIYVRRGSCDVETARDSNVKPGTRWEARCSSFGSASLSDRWSGWLRLMRGSSDDWMMERTGFVAGRASSPGKLLIRDYEYIYGVQRADFVIVAPCWALAMLLGAWPMWRVFKWLENGSQLRKRRREGLCGRCGYDLRGSVGRCPECGDVPLDAARERAG